MPTLEENQQFERYRINRCLGNGVSSESYEATDTIRQCKVTLKLIHPWAALPESAQKQFSREMQVISQLNHPYLASIIDYGELDNQLYVVRRYVSSGSLINADGRLWYQPPLRVVDAIHFGSQLAQALDHIHQHGYLHGSLTFSNILVLRGRTSDQEEDFAPFLLADVGLANFVRRFGQPTHPFVPLTTAPEQLGKRVTPASDQYALAVILYFWFSGHPPFIGTPEEVAHLKLTETIPALATLNTNVTFVQENILRRALSVYPEERYPSILAFADALVATLVPTPQFEAAPLRDQIPNPEPLPTPAPEPLPVPAPDPLPQPAPELLPVPAPEPLPEPAPEPLPEPAPEPMPQPAPDVFTPLPETISEPLQVPQTDFDNEPTTPPEFEALQFQGAQTLPPWTQQGPMQSYLVITPPELAETYEFVLQYAEITIGRAGDSDILLEQDTRASRHHALLKRENDSYFLYDLRSATGVFVNDKKLPLEDGYQLVPGDKITIGNHEMIFYQAMSLPNQMALHHHSSLDTLDRSIGISA